jgi:general secretion pathway protein G
VAVAEVPTRGVSPGRCRSGRTGVGFTLIELIVVVCIVAVSATLLLDRLRYYQEAAEKAAMEQQVAALKSAAQLRAAALLVRGEERNIESLARVNPIEWLVEPPRGYRGEFRTRNANVPPGSWYFDATDTELVYVPNLDAHLKPGLDGSKRLRFRVQLDYEPAASAPGGRRSLAAARVVPVAPYEWF